MSKHFSDDFEYGTEVSNTYSIADLYATESYLFDQLARLEMSGGMDEDYWEMRGKRDSIGIILRVRVEQLLKDYEKEERT